MNLITAFLTSTGGGTLADILSAATEMLSWFITSMGSIVNFITSNPVILVLFLIMLVGAAVGMFFRVWKSA